MVGDDDLHLDSSPSDFDQLFEEGDIRKPSHSDHDPSLSPLELVEDEGPHIAGMREVGVDRHEQQAVVSARQDITSPHMAQARRSVVKPGDAGVTLLSIILEPSAPNRVELRAVDLEVVHRSGEHHVNPIRHIVPPLVLLGGHQIADSGNGDLGRLEPGYIPPEAKTDHAP